MNIFDDLANAGTEIICYTSYWKQGGEKHLDIPLETPPLAGQTYFVEIYNIPADLREGTRIWLHYRTHNAYFNDICNTSDIIGSGFCYGEITDVRLNEHNVRNLIAFRVERSLSIPQMAVHYPESDLPQYWNDAFLTWDLPFQVTKYTRHHLLAPGDVRKHYPAPANSHSTYYSLKLGNPCGQYLSAVIAVQDNELYLIRIYESYHQLESMEFGAKYRISHELKAAILNKAIDAPRAVPPIQVELKTKSAYTLPEELKARFGTDIICNPCFWRENLEVDYALNEIPLTGSSHYVVVYGPLTIQLFRRIWLFYEPALMLYNGPDSAEEVSGCRFCYGEVRDILETTEDEVLIQFVVEKTLSMEEMIYYAAQQPLPEETSVCLQEHIGWTTVVQYGQYYYMEFNVCAGTGVRAIAVLDGDDMDIVMFNDWMVTGRFLSGGRYRVDDVLKTLIIDSAA